MIKTKSLIHISKRCFYQKDDFMYFQYFWHKKRIWYFKENLYENLYDGASYKNYSVINRKSYTRLIPFSKEKYSLLYTRDFHQESNSKKLIDDVSAQINNFDDSSTIDDIIDIANSKVEEQKQKNKNIGIFWLFGGDNRRRLIYHLFEYNNFIPHKSNNYFIQIQQAPFNPYTHESHVVEHNFFDFMSLPDKDGIRYIDKDEINEFSKNLQLELELFIKDNNLDKVILGGFSQGGAMSLYLAMTMNENLFQYIHSVISLNSLLLDITPLHTDRINALNFLFINGINDDIITVREARDSYLNIRKLHDSKKILTFIEEPGLHHAFSQTSIENVKSFLNKIN